MKTIRFALRNIGRNRDRTRVTIGAMAFAGAIMIFYVSLIEGFIETLERNMIQMSIGDMQMHHKDYRNDPDLYKRIDNPGEIVEKLAASGLNAAPRLYGFGLAAAGASSSGVTLRGVDIEREKTVTKVHEHVLKGKWLDDADPHGVVVGRKLARTLGVGLGDEIVLVSQAADGSMANDLYTTRGILKSVGEGIDRAGLFMPEGTFRELMAVPEGAHEIVIIRQDRHEDIDLAAAHASAAAPGLETLTWRDIQPVIASLLDTTDAMNLVMLLIVYAAIGMVTLNAMLMSVFERIREFGIMKAIGVSPWRLMALVYAEAVAQVAIACVLASAVGIPLSLYYEKHGLDLSAIAPGGGSASIAGVAMDPVWHTYVTPSSVGYPLLTLVAVVLVAVIYPGVKAAVIQPVKAIHYV